MSTMSRAILLTVVHLAALGGCTSEPGGASQSASLAAFNPVFTLGVGSKVGDVVTKEFAVSGRERASVPDTRSWSCGAPLRGTLLSNVAWLELVNPSPDTVSLSVALGGLEETHPKLFVYAARNAPLRECLTFSGHRNLSGTSSVVVEPGSYAGVLVSTDAATGVYTISVTTEHVITP